MYAVLRIATDGIVIASNTTAGALLGRCDGSRCCDVVLARGDQKRMVCNPTCSAHLLGLSSREETDQRVQIRGRLCRIVCTRVGDEGVVIIEPGPAASSARLTDRERQALLLVAEGLSSEEIAIRLGVSASTARTHVERAREKLCAPSRAAAVAIALRRGEI